MKKALAAALAGFAVASAARGQTLSGIAATLHPLNLHDSDQYTNVMTWANGPRIVPDASGGLWFLESQADRIAYYKADAITEWPIRSHSYQDPYRSIGANPSDFEVDGTTIWFIENGNSGIDVQQSVFASLDTTTNLLTEWVLPVAKPAAFLREPDGVTVWIAMSQGTLVRLNLQTLAVDSFRSPTVLGYSGMIRAADGSFWLTDFGNNRIIKLDPTAMTETYWELYDPAKYGTLQITQPTFGANGDIFVSEDYSSGGIGRFDPATGKYDRFALGYLYYPTHFFLQGGFVYGVDTDPAGGDGVIFLLDTSLAAATSVTATPASDSLVELSLPAAIERSTTLTPIAFTSSDKSPDSAIVASSPATGVSLFTVPSGSTFTETTSFSIVAEGGKVAAGLTGALAEFTLLPSGNDGDLYEPLALSQSDGSVRGDFLIYSRAAPHGALNVTDYASPLPPPLGKDYTLSAGQTLEVPNALGSADLKAGNSAGSLRFSPDPNDVGNYQVVVRNYAVRSDGATYGFALSANAGTTGVSTGNPGGALFLGSESFETSIFGLYSYTGASGSVVLHGADGAVRGSYAFFLPANNRQEFNPAFSAFGVPAEAGDYLTFDVSSGSIFPYATAYQTTGDAAVQTPVAPLSDFVFPFVGSGPGAQGASYVSSVLFANPDPNNAVSIAAGLYPVSGAAPSGTQLSVPPGGVAKLEFSSPEAAVFGALLVKASGPVWALARLANRTATGDFAAFEMPQGSSGDSRFLVSSGLTRRKSLVLFNRGGAGEVTVEGFDDKGNPNGRFTVSLADHATVSIPDVQIRLGLLTAGRIEVVQTPGTLVYSVFAETDRTTGDAYVEAPFPR